MKNENKYWEELVSSVESSEEMSFSKTSPQEDKRLSDYQWLVKTRQQLRQVFHWDLFDKQSAKIRLEYRLQNNDQQKNPGIFHTVWFRAAVILVAVVSGAFLHFLMSVKVQDNLFTEITVPAGQMTQIKLPDGSKVLLNSGSIFRYPAAFGNSSREVSIDGEAFMEVASDPEKPFRVTTSKFTVEVLGTTFNITAYSNENNADVTLLEGLVKIKTGKNNQVKEIVPGQSASIVEGDLKEIDEVNTQFYTSWKDGKIVFRKETLEEIAKKLERWYNVEIRFADDDLKKQVFSGTLLKYKPVEQVFKSLILLNKDVDFVSESRADQKDIIYIKRRNANK